MQAWDGPCWLIRVRCDGGADLSELVETVIDAPLSFFCCVAQGSAIEEVVDHFARQEIVECQKRSAQVR